MFSITTHFPAPAPAPVDSISWCGEMFVPNPNPAVEIFEELAAVAGRKLATDHFNRRIAIAQAYRLAEQAKGPIFGPPNYPGSTGFQSRMPYGGLVRYARRLPSKRKDRRGTHRKVGYRGTFPNGYASKNRRTGGFVGIERKFLDVSLERTVFGVNWTRMDPAGAPIGSINCISCPAQGVGESQHIGRTYFIRSLFIHGGVFLPSLENSPTEQNDAYYRICVVLDKQTNGAPLVANNVMKEAPQASIALSFRNLQESHRYDILMDTGPRVLKVGPSVQTDGGIGAAITYARTGIFGSWKLSKIFAKPIKVRTDATGANVSSVTDFSIHVIAVCNTSVLELQYESRMRFSETSA